MSNFIERWIALHKEKFKETRFNPQKHSEFVNRLLSSISTVQKYKNLQLQAMARSQIPNYLLNSTNNELERLKELLDWFKTSYFTWVNQPKCEKCQKDAIFLRQDGPNAQEMAWEAQRIEVYSCSSCSSIIRFPRYNHPQKLMETRRGRCGEWANTFTLFCIAAGFEARYVIDFTDHVWTEVYLNQFNRWVNCDSCEGSGSVDQPLMYEKGWGKKLNYIFGVGLHEIVDVVSRYTANRLDIQSRRTMVPEMWLHRCLLFLTRQLQTNIPAAQLQVIHQRRDKETTDLQEQLMNNMTIQTSHLSGRTSGSVEWRAERGELGKYPSLAFKDGAIVCTMKDIISLNGSAKQTSEYIQLTANKTNQCGSFFVQLPSVQSFCIEVGFKMSPQGADGMAIVIQGQDAKALGHSGCGLGYDGLFKSVAIELDTYANDNVKDPNGNHISIHTNGHGPNSSHHKYSKGCNGYIPQLNNGQLYGCRVYVNQEKVSVFLSENCQLSPGFKAKDYFLVVEAKEESIWTMIQELSNIWVGMTATTGGLSQEHAIYYFQIMEFSD